MTPPIIVSNRAVRRPEKGRRLSKTAITSAVGACLGAAGAVAVTRDGLLQLIADSTILQGLYPHRSILFTAYPHGALWDAAAGAFVGGTITRLVVWSYTSIRRSRAGKIIKQRGLHANEVEELIP